MIIPSRRYAFPAAIAAVAACLGGIVALHYYHAGLTLSHYDARGHLIVARRIADSITPGWQQIGGVWLPLPHILNFLPVQIDLFYRTGASGVALSVAAFALAAAAIAWIVRAVTNSAVAAVGAAAAFALNPNVLYLQATPMTEPLLLGLTLLALALLMEWLRSTFSTAIVGWAFVLACLTRYEAWPVTACALLIGLGVLWRRGPNLSTACRRIGGIALYPAVAAVSFVLISRVIMGEWFTASGFFVPENKALGRPIEAAAEIWWGVHALTGSITMAIAAVGLCALLVRGCLARGRPESLVALALAGSAALPWAAFVRGHPFRIRYMVPLIAVEAVGIGAAIALVRRAVVPAALLVTALLAYEARPFNPLAPMVLEAQWDRPNAAARQRVTGCLRANYDGEKIMASMGSLGHYMQETARDGFNLRDFLHEGNGDIWLSALQGPRRYAGWLLIEEKAEGGDMLAKIARADPSFLDGYERQCEGAGVALYRRVTPWPRPRDP